MLFNLPKRKIDDPVFGSMTLVDDETCYQGMCYFTPLGTEILMSVFSRLREPSEKQRSLFKEIEKNYFTCVERLPAVVEDEFRKGRKDFSIINFSKEFGLIGIIIPELDASQGAFVLEYDTIHELDGWINVRFVDWEPNKVSFVQ
jgi:hypothetical protein